MEDQYEGAFTGLEAAIVLIAFVTVAAVFAYVILGAGFFATQKSQEVIHSGIQQTSSVLMLAGSVYGIGTPGSTVDMVNFTVAISAGGTPINMEKVVITYSDRNRLESLSPVAGYFSYSTTPGTWAIIDRQNDRGESNNLLEKGEQFTLSVHPSVGIAKDIEFSIQVAPSGGAVMEIRRTVPAAVYAVNQFY
jgi:flagellin FlaB